MQTVIRVEFTVCGEQGITNSSSRFLYFIHGLQGGMVVLDAFSDFSVLQTGVFPLVQGINSDFVYTQFPKRHLTKGVEKKKFLFCWLIYHWEY